MKRYIYGISKDKPIKGHSYNFTYYLEHARRWVSGLGEYQGESQGMYAVKCALSTDKENVGKIIWVRQLTNQMV